MKAYWKVDDTMYEAEVDSDVTHLGIGGPCPHHGTETQVNYIYHSFKYACGNRVGEAWITKAEHPWPAKVCMVQRGGNHDALVVSESGKPTKVIKGNVKV